MVNSGTKGTWVDETDIRPTLIYLTGLKDDYEHDGRVVTQIVAHQNSALSAPGVAARGPATSSSTPASASSAPSPAGRHGPSSQHPGDARYRTDRALTGLDKVRDALALRIKAELESAAFGEKPILARPAQRSPAGRSSPGPLCSPNADTALRAAPPPRPTCHVCARPGAGVAQLGGGPSPASPATW